MTTRLRRLAQGARLIWDLRQFLRQPIDLDQARAAIRQRLDRRNDHFLSIVERAVYGQSTSPYLPLLRAAGCELGDLRLLVEREGLEATLAALVRAGVYITFDEFKGRREIVRGSTCVPCTEQDFDNPRSSPTIEARSGGTRSQRTVVKMEFPFLADIAISTAVALDAHGLDDYDHAVWMSHLQMPLVYAKLGRPPLGWFAEFDAYIQTPDEHSRLLIGLSRLLGCYFQPEFTAVTAVDRLVDWLVERQRDGRKICLTVYASSAVRLAAAATRRGISLDGAAFMTLGEPLTATKQQLIEASGARTLARYGFTEGGVVGYACSASRYEEDLHFLSDSYGLVQRDRAVGDESLTVPAFLFTSLLPSTPKILINVESGDYGVLERHDCGCPYEALGLTEHVSAVRSFEKLSSEGLTFIKTDLLSVLEQVLPSRFGGNSTDYQVLEQEQGDGILRLSLLIDPSIGAIDEAEAYRLFVEKLGATHEWGPRRAAFLEQAGSIRVERRQPVPTKVGKILPFHISVAGDSSPRSAPATPRTTPGLGRPE